MAEPIVGEVRTILRRVLRRVLWRLSFVLLMGAFVSIRYGILEAVSAIGGTFVISYLGVWLIFRWDLSRDRARRAGGQLPSWYASIPAMDIVRLGGSAGHSANLENAIPGRLVLAADELRWMPTKGLLGLPSGTLVWNRDCPIRVVPMRWLFGFGRIVLSRPDGIDTLLWTRNVHDFQRTLLER